MGTFTVPVTGGEVTLTDGELAGLTLSVPADALANPLTVTLAYRPVVTHHLPEGLTLLSPAIEVNTGTTEAARLLTLRVPISLPAGNFAMGFLYDDQARTLEGLPFVDLADDAATCAARRFVYPPPSKQAANEPLPFYVAVVSAPTDRFAINLDTGFIHGEDDFAFENQRTYLAPQGVCNGQALANLYDFATRRLAGGGEPLYTLFDNRRFDAGPRLATPGFDLDDEQALVLCSTIQEEADWQDADYGAQLSRNESAGPQWTYAAILLAMLVTGEPQLVSVVQSATRTGHALLAYAHQRLGADAATEGRDLSDLIVADPNFPYRRGLDEAERRLVFDHESHSLRPYTSALVAGDPSMTFDTIYFLGKRSAIHWDAVVDGWASLADGTLEASLSPWVGRASLSATPGAESVPLVGEVTLEAERIYVRGDASLFADFEVELFDPLERSLGVAVGGAPLAFDLDLGENRLGILMRARPPTETDRLWAGFSWVTIHNDAPAPTTIQELGGVDLFDAAGAVAVIGDTAWVLDAAGSLTEVNAPLGAAPSLGTTQLDVAVHSTQRGLTVVDANTLLVGGGSVTLVDLRQPTGPWPVAAFNADCGRAAVVGSYAYVACGERSYTPEGLLGVVDLTDPADLDRPRAVGELVLGSTIQIRDVVLFAPGLLGVLDSDNDVHLVEIANPTQPSRASGIDTAYGNGRALAASGSLLFAGGDSFAVLDPTATAAPVRHEEAVGGTVYALAAGGGYAFLAGDASGEPFFTILSLANINSPQVAQFFAPAVRGRALVRQGSEALLLGNVGAGPARLVRLAW